jgi:outer membrane protein assembly factor BamB
MKMKIRNFIAIIVALAMGGMAQAQSERRLTTTLLPVKEAGASKETGANAGLLWVQTSPAQDIYVQFDLGSLPPGLQEADFIRCTLRLVAQDVTYVPAGNLDSGGLLVIVKGQKANDDLRPIAKAQEVVSLSTLSDGEKKNNIALGAADDLRKAVYQEYAGDKLITLRLHTDSHKASSLIYSSVNSGAKPSNLPRLVIEYKLPPPDLLESAAWSQHQQNPEHSGRSPWLPFRAPTGFTLAKIAVPRIDQNVAGIVDYPLIYQGKIYLISKVLDQNHLFSLDFKGAERWRQAIGKAVVQRSPVISRSGILYIVTENQIAGYDLNQQGKIFASFALTGKSSAYTDVTQGNDGSLFLAMVENDLNYIYGFTAGLKPFLKSGPLAKGQEKVSTITVSPDGRKVFAQTPAGAVAIDIANPSVQSTLALANDKDKPFEYYHVPVAAPASDLMVFADFTSKANQGHLWGYTSNQQIWSASGTLLPQPVLGANGRVYYIQDGSLQARKYDQLGAGEVIASDANLNATSNLVMDGADNIYFWNNGYLHGYAADGNPLFARIPLTSEVQERKSQTVEGPEQFLRLMMGPDGTLWANNRNGDSLFAFKPAYAPADLTLQPKDIKSRTAYRTEGKLTVGGVSIEANKQALFQAQNGIGFASGFKVEKGASLMARTGF